MHNAIELVIAKNFSEAAAIANIHAKQLIMRSAQMPSDIFLLNCGIVEVVEVINDCDVRIAGGQKTINQMRANKSGAPCNQDFLHTKNDQSRTTKKLFGRIDPQVPAPARRQLCFKRARQHFSQQRQPPFVKEMSTQCYSRKFMKQLARFAPRINSCQRITGTVRVLA